MREAIHIPTGMRPTDAALRLIIIVQDGVLVAAVRVRAELLSQKATGKKPLSMIYPYSYNVYINRCKLYNTQKTGGMLLAEIEGLVIGRFAATAAQLPGLLMEE